MISAIYQVDFKKIVNLTFAFEPQNVYCLVVDDKAEEQFKMEMLLLADCFPTFLLWLEEGHGGNFL
jgi:hypothetical protein